MNSAPAVIVAKGGENFRLPRSGNLNGRPWFYLDKNNYLWWSSEDLAWQSRFQSRDSGIEWLSHALASIVDEGKVIHIDLDNSNAWTRGLSLRKGGALSIIKKVLQLLCLMYLTEFIFFLCLNNLQTISLTAFLPFKLPLSPQRFIAEYFKNMIRIADFIQ